MPPDWWLRGRKKYGMILGLTKPSEYAVVSKWGRLRALPVADKASSKEWPRSKKSRINVSPMIFSLTATGHNGAPRSIRKRVNPLRTGKTEEMQRYRSGHNGADSKSVWSNPRGFESHPLRQEKKDAFGASFFSYRWGCPQGKSYPLRQEKCIKNFWKEHDFLLDMGMHLCYYNQADDFTEGACGCSTMARAPAFQAGDAGSIPVTRSIVSLMRQ